MKTPKLDIFHCFHDPLPGKDSWFIWNKEIKDFSRSSSLCRRHLHILAFKKIKGDFVPQIMPFFNLLTIKFL